MLFFTMVKEVIKRISTCDDCVELEELWKTWGLQDDSLDLAFLLNKHFKNDANIESIKLLKPDVYSRVCPSEGDVVAMGAFPMTGWDDGIWGLSECTSSPHLQNIKNLTRLNSGNWLNSNFRGLVLKPRSAEDRVWSKKSPFSYKGDGEKIFYSLLTRRYVFVRSDGETRSNGRGKYLPQEGERFSIVWDGTFLTFEEHEVTLKSRAMQIVDWITAASTEDASLSEQKYDLLVGVAEMVEVQA